MNRVEYACETLVDDLKGDFYRYNYISNDVKKELNKYNYLFMNGDKFKDACQFH